MSSFQTKTLTLDADVIAPDGSEVRLLAKGQQGSMAHFSLKPGQVSKAVAHHTVEELWYVVGGAGEMWRKDHQGESIEKLQAGVSLSIPVGTHFQFRATSETLQCVGVTMPSWPGVDEAFAVNGPWVAQLV